MPGHRFTLQLCCCCSCILKWMALSVPLCSSGPESLGWRAPVPCTATSAVQQNAACCGCVTVLSAARRHPHQPCGRAVSGVWHQSAAHGGCRLTCGSSSAALSWAQSVACVLKRFWSHPTCKIFARCADIAAWLLPSGGLAIYAANHCAALVPHKQPMCIPETVSSSRNTVCHVHAGDSH